MLAGGSNGVAKNIGLCLLLGQTVTGRQRGKKTITGRVTGRNKCSVALETLFKVDAPTRVCPVQTVSYYESRLISVDSTGSFEDILVVHCPYLYSITGLQDASSSKL